MVQKPEKKKKYLALWAILCAFVVLVGIAVPVKESRSLGLEGANQANLSTATEELTAGRVLKFTLEPPTDAAEQIGFFFKTNQHEYTEGTLRILAMDEETQTVIGGQDFALEELTEDGFLFVALEETPETLTVSITCDAPEEGPSVWLNETTRTVGSAWLDGAELEKSLIYNLTYTVKVHRILTPLLVGLILFLGGVGVYAAGGFVRREQIPAKKTQEKKGGRIPHVSVRQAVGLLAAVILTAALFFYLYDTRIRIAQNTTEKETVLEADGEMLPVTEETASVSQIVKPGQDSLTGLGVRFYLNTENGESLTEGYLYASVTDLTLGEVLCETTVEASQILSGEYVGLLFDDSQTGVADHEYRIDLEFSEELWDSGLEIFTSEEGLCVTAYLYYNIFLKRFFFCIFLGAEAFVCLFWYLTFVRRAKIETVFLATVLSLGLIYNVMLTPQMVPDEAKHIDMAYRYSNELLGYESLGDSQILMRADDAELEFTSSPSFSNYRNIYYGLFSLVENDEMVAADVSSNIEGSFLFYAPAALMMSLARILRLGTVPMLLLARYANLVVFAFLTWLGMQRLPFGKATLFVLAILPVNLQQCTSFSHDAMVHGILFLYSCLCLEAIFGKEDRPMTGQRMVLMELAALSLVYCKSGSYAPLCLLPVLIPAACYGGKKQKYMATGALLGIPALAFLWKNVQTIAGIVGTTAATSVVSTGDGTEYLTGYTVGYFLNDPLEFVYMMVNTVLDKTGFYLESLVGYKLGWVEIETSQIVVLLFLFLLFLSVCNTPACRVKVSAAQRGWMLLLCLGCTGLILLGMLFQWTPMGYVSVEGVQGRYFLPFLMILLTACRTDGISLNRNIDRGILAAAASGQLLTLAYVIRYVCMV